MGDSHTDGICSVLVVDDEASVRSVVATVLRRGGYRVTAVADAITALDILHADGQIALLLTDIRMPGIDGVELYRRAARAYPGVRICFMSGHAVPGEADLPVHAPLLVKPFTGGELLETVKRLLGLSISTALTSSEPASIRPDQSS